MGRLVEGKINLGEVFKSGKLVIDLCHKQMEKLEEQILRTDIQKNKLFKINTLNWTMSIKDEIMCQFKSEMLHTKHTFAA